MIDTYKKKPTKPEKMKRFDLGRKAVPIQTIEEKAMTWSDHEYPLSAALMSALEAGSKLLDGSGKPAEAIGVSKQCYDLWRGEVTPDDAKPLTVNHVEEMYKRLMGVGAESLNEVPPPSLREYLAENYPEPSLAEQYKEIKAKMEFSVPRADFFDGKLVVARVTDGGGLVVFGHSGPVISDNYMLTSEEVSDFQDWLADVFD